MAEKAAAEKATPDKAALEKSAAKKSAAKKAAAKKAAAKKEQQKNKKTKQNKRKKSKENGVNHWFEYHVPYINISHKKKEGNKISYQKKNFHYSSKKKSGSPFKVVFKFLFTGMIYLLLILGFLYIVDFEKFVHIRNGTALVLNKTVSLLPAEVISKGNGVIQYIHPTVEIIVGKIRVALNETSTLLNTNPLLKDHWTNIREISSICSERLIDYIRTLYLQITGYFHCAKHKLFQ